MIDINHCVSEWHILIRVFTFLCFVTTYNIIFIIFQLGAGVSLPGIVAAKCGAHVTLSDTAEIPLCLENSRRCCELNNLSGVSVVGLTWGEISPELTSLPPMDIILGSDVFYEPEGETVPGFMYFFFLSCPTNHLSFFLLIDFEDVLATLSFLLKRNPSGQFWTTFQERRYQYSFIVNLWEKKIWHVLRITQMFSKVSG